MIVAPFVSAADGITREMALFRAGQPTLMLWQAENPALVVPAPFMKRPGIRDVINEIQRVGTKIATRGSGGGIVPQGPCMLNLAMVLPASQGFTLEDGYRLICGAVAEALTRFDITTQTGACPGSFCDGAWNVLAGGHKLAGTAQRVRSTSEGPVVLLHAAILLQLPDPGHWTELCLLHQAAFPTDPPLTPDAHTTLGALMPQANPLTSFPGALIRAAEDRLFALARREDQAA